MKSDLQVHVVRCNTTYWYAEVEAKPGVRIDGRGGFESEAAARAWAQAVQQHGANRAATSQERAWQLAGTR